MTNETPVKIGSKSFPRIIRRTRIDLRHGSGCQSWWIFVLAVRYALHSEMDISQSSVRTKISLVRLIMGAANIRGPFPSQDLRTPSLSGRQARLSWQNRLFSQRRHARVRRDGSPVKTKGPSFRAERLPSSRFTWCPVRVAYAFTTRAKSSHAQMSRSNRSYRRLTEHP